MTPQRPMINKGMYPGYLPQQQQSGPYMQQQQQQPGMNPQLRGMMPRYPNPPGVKRPASSSMFGQNMMSNGPPMPQQQQQQNMPGNYAPFPAQVKQETNFPPQYPVSSHSALAIGVVDDFSPTVCTNWRWKFP